MSPGRVVVLNGTSAGKTTLARAIQRLATNLWVVVGQDDFAQNLTPRWVKVDGGFDGGRGEEGFHFVRDPSATSTSKRQRSVAGCCEAIDTQRQRVPGRATTSWSMSASSTQMAGTSGSRRSPESTPCGFELNAILKCAHFARRHGLTCQLIGLARGQYERVHANATYDLAVDLTADDVEAAATAVLAATGV